MECSHGFIFTEFFNSSWMGFAEDIGQSFRNKDLNKSGSAGGNIICFVISFKLVNQAWLVLKIKVWKIDKIIDERKRYLGRTFIRDGNGIWHSLISVVRVFSLAIHYLNIIRNLSEHMY